MQTSPENRCPVEDAAAYLDGELSGVAMGNFEGHVAQCPSCAAELRTQRQLLCTLDAAFHNSPRFNLPANFTRVVAAHAESDLRGLSDKKERRRALQLCALLVLGAFALLGATSGALVFQPARSFILVITRVFGLLWETLYDAGIGVGIILRMIGRAAVASPYGFGSFVALTFLLAISLLPRLIANYHRAKIIE
jgi:anti-sigma factor RsiW